MNTSATLSTATRPDNVPRLARLQARQAELDAAWAAFDALGDSDTDEPCTCTVCPWSISDRILQVGSVGTLALMVLAACGVGQ
jgi:hypothetical protein